MQAEAIRPLSLYAITDELRALEEVLLESGGEITPEIEEAYGELLAMQADKVESYVAMIRKFEASADAIEQEEKRLAAAKRTMQNSAKNLKSRLAWCMQQRGETEHSTRLGLVKLRRSGSRPVVLKVDVEKLPSWFKRVKVDPDLAALRQALKEGDAGEYAELGEASIYIQIY